MLELSTFAYNVYNITWHIDLLDSKKLPRIYTSVTKQGCFWDLHRVSSRQHVVVFRGKVSKQIVGIPMGTNFAPLLDDIFFSSHEAELTKSLLLAGKKQLASQINITYQYISDVLSINNPYYD